MTAHCHFKTGDTLLTKKGGKISRWLIISVETGAFRARNPATGQIRKFRSQPGRIIVPPDEEVPESLRKQFPKGIGVCRAIGSQFGAYKLFLKSDLETIDLQQESISVFPIDFTIKDGEAVWSTEGETHVDARNVFFARKAVKLPSHLAKEIEAQVTEQF